MIIKQEEESPVDDVFYNCKVPEVFKLLKETSTGLAVDTVLVQTVIEEAISMLKNYSKELTKLENRLSKQNAKTAILDKLHEHDYLD